MQLNRLATNKKRPRLRIICSVPNTVGQEIIEAIARKQACRISTSWIEGFSLNVKTSFELESSLTST